MKSRLAIADIPVKISILHDTEPLKEYEDVIPVEFDPKTSEGNNNVYRYSGWKKWEYQQKTRCLKLPAIR